MILFSTYARNNSCSLVGRQFIQLAQSTGASRSSFSASLMQQIFSILSAPVTHS